jgi:hypothetical protein
LQKKAITTKGLGAFENMGGVLIDKQGEGGAKTLNSPNVNMTVMKMSQDIGK